MLVRGIRVSARNPYYDPNTGRNSSAARSFHFFLRPLLAVFIAGASLLAPSRSHAQACAIKPGTSIVPLCQSPGATCSTNGNLGGGVQGTCRQLSDECECFGIAAPTYTVGVNVSGLTGGTLELQDNRGPSFSITGNGLHIFPARVANEKPYKVTVQSQPAGQQCTLGGNSSGAINSANVTVDVTCTSTVAATYSLTVTVLGPVSGPFRVKNGNTLVTISADGTFIVASGLLSGTPYGVVMEDQPPGGFCTLGSNSSGHINGANVNVPVTCLSSSSWVPIGPAPVAEGGPCMGGNAGRINVAAADPTNPAVIYVGSAGGGVWKTSNAVSGMTAPTWQPLTDNVPAPSAAPSNQASLMVGGSPRGLSVHPLKHNLIQAAVSDSGGGILLSSQAGAPGSWSLMGNSQGGGPLFDHRPVNSIAVHPSNTQVVYAATGLGLYQTSNGGQTWAIVGGLPTSYVYDVMFARFDSTGKTLFVSVIGSGVYRSTNGGTSWTQLNALPNAAQADGIQMDSGSRGALYVSLLFSNAIERYRSSNTGDTWTALAAAPGGVEKRNWHQLIAVDPQNDNHIFANGNNGGCCYALYESLTGGQSVNGAPAWTEVDVQQTSGPVNYDWVSVSFDANGKVLATADQGIFRYDPTGPVGQNWCSLDGNLEITTLYTVTVDNQDIAATAQDQYFAFFTPNNGQPHAQWQSVGTGGEIGRVLLPQAGANFGYVYNPLSDSNYDLVWRAPVTSQTPLPSTQWKPIFSENSPNNSQEAFVMDPFNRTRLLVGLDQVYEILDADVSSLPPNPIGPCPLSGGSYVTAIAIAPSNPVYIYAATNDGHVWVTTSDGTLNGSVSCAGWVENDIGLSGNVVVGMRVDPNNPQHVFAVTGNWGGTWELGPPAASGQQTWQNRSGPTGLNVYTIFVDWQYSPAPHLYVGTDRGVYTSTSPVNPASWTAFGTGLPNVQVDDLEAIPWTTSPPYSLLVAGTYGRSAFEILLTEPPPAPPAPAPAHPPTQQLAPKRTSPVPPWEEHQQPPVPSRPPAPPSKP